MFSEKIHFQISYFLLMLAMITIPFTIFFMLPILNLLFLNFIFQNRWRLRWNRIKENKMDRYLWLFLSFFILYLIGMFYTNNIRYGFTNIENKLWFLLIPFLIFMTDRTFFTPKKIFFLIFVFIISTAVMSISNMCISTIQYMKIPDIALFYYGNASHLPTWRPMHPSYLSMYITFSFVATLYYLFLSPITLNKWIKWVLMATFPFFIMFNYLLQSKTGLIVFVLVLISSVLFLINRKKNHIGRSLIFVFLIVVSLIGTLKYGSGTMNRIPEGFKYFLQGDHKDDASVSRRVVAWKISIEQALKHLPFGVGTGDVEDVLVNQYQKQNYVELSKERLNSHNQYIHTFLAIGIMGLISILIYFLIPLYQTIKRKKFLYFSFLCIVLINLLTESMFETGAGANFIALFMCLLAYDSFVPHDKQSLRTKE